MAHVAVTFLVLLQAVPQVVGVREKGDLDLHGTAFSVEGGNATDTVRGEGKELCKWLDAHGIFDFRDRHGQKGEDRPFKKGWMWIRVSCKSSGLISKTYEVIAELLGRKGFRFAVFNTLKSASLKEEDLEAFARGISLELVGATPDNLLRQGCYVMGGKVECASGCGFKLKGQMLKSGTDGFLDLIGSGEEMRFKMYRDAASVKESLMNLPPGADGGVSC
mmetsp:Transcript_81131/g.224534  ORF Transcript_81131/g.224534 Transcript_81131/m.224534 type:complete len:220 (+) Transcript_81131:116-775(+)|eukprot:CAMPEP_0179075488 /NCGR_PEP_ID=MMETSP0796-20121207/33619_1 /TAXON_ID=73915 /ORGANISM="Pyrodinium bahamense, Strain pbaha01" /LENGTH=219 /DNA_ID=CAMNT_0020772727 /DNA_START=111 /DNA_END=770 /DNA_ORIENTATION=+